MSQNDETIIEIGVDIGAPPAPATPVVAMTIAGSDSSGGAGIQADLKTFHAFGVYGASVITALTAQNTRGVSAIHAVPPAFISAQFEAVTSDLTVRAIKTGMLGDAATVMSVAALLRTQHRTPIVVDPVMVASSGDVLLAPDAIDAVKGQLIPVADLITPNLAEAAALLATPLARSISEQTEQAKRLMDFGARAVLVKGGHGPAGETDAIDVFSNHHGVHIFRARRIATHNSHGTGCTLSAAIAAGLARGDEMTTAIGNAKAYLTRALNASMMWTLGGGHGPVDHRVTATPHDGET